MVRLVFAVGLVLGGCKFDGGGIPHDAEPEFPDADPSCVPTGDEQCNAIDDDCDGPVDEDFPTLGDDCDGADADECLEGTFVCNSAGDDVECDDVTDDIVEACDGADEDCDGMADDGFEVGVECDGADLDLCTEGGVWQCDGAGDRECTDTSGDTAEVCDGLGGDEDCDGDTDEDWLFDTDESNCGGCNIVCQANNTVSNLCLATDCTPVCSAGANDCDSNPNNGCELRNTSPTCSTTVVNLGSIRGDTGTGGTLAGDSGYAEAWYQVTLNETDKENNSGGNIIGTVGLAVPDNTNFDLFVYCPNCAGSQVASSASGTAGTDELINLRNDDSNGDDDGYTIIIEIRWIAATACGNWTLTVTGNAGSGGDNIGDGCEP
jgi:hypothetical protein